MAQRSIGKGNATAVAGWELGHTDVSPDGRTVLHRSILSPNCGQWALDLARA
jgi:hypothetical protein